MSVNNVVIVGNLCRDPELRKNTYGTSMLSFTVAVNEKYKNSATDTWENKAVYVPCIVFGNYADALERYLSKGTEVLVAGKLNFRSWESDGRNVTKLEVIGQEVKSLRQPKTQSTQPQTQSSSHAQASAQDYAPIPF